MDEAERYQASPSRRALTLVVVGLLWIGAQTGWQVHCVHLNETRSRPVDMDLVWNSVFLNFPVFLLLCAMLAVDRKGQLDDNVWELRWGTVLVLAGVATLNVLIAFGFFYFYYNRIT